MKRFINILSFATLFVVPIVLFDSPFEGYFFYILMLLCLPILMVLQNKQFKFSVNAVYLKVMVLLLFLNIISIGLGTNTVPLFLKTFIGILFAFTFYYYLVKFNDFEIERLFKYYLVGCKIIVTIGIIQYISFHLDFWPGYDYSWILNKWKVIYQKGFRVNSIIQEPAHLVRLLGPAFFVSVHSLIFRNRFIKRRWALLIITVFFLANSSLGFIGAAICLVLLTFNYAKIKYILLAAVFIPLAILVLYQNEEGFRLRADSGMNLLTGKELVGSNVDVSTFTVYNNLQVAIGSFKRNPLFGGGLGSHPRSFKRYSLVATLGLRFEELNTMDAASYFVRTVSESGLIGVGLVFFFLIKFYIKRKPGQAGWLISNAILMLFLMCLIRAGHYFLYGLPLFIWIYYYNWKFNSKQGRNYVS